MKGKNKKMYSYSSYILKSNFELNNIIDFLIITCESKKYQSANEKDKNNLEHLITNKKIDMGFYNDIRDYMCLEFSKQKVYFNILEHGSFYNLVLITSKDFSKQKEINNGIIKNIKELYKKKLNLEKFKILKDTIKRR